jgi:hypothetical protein
MSEQDPKAGHAPEQYAPPLQIGFHRPEDGP